jgi:branched-chain amino acid transport system substrate-binding protein
MQLERLKKVAPEALVLWADPRAAGRIVHHMRAAGMNIPVFACDRIIHPDFFAEAGPAAEGVVAVATFLPDEQDPGYRSFLERYRARYGSDPTAYAAYAYDGLMLGIQAIRRVGLNRAKIRDALAEATRTPHRGITGPISFEHDLSNRRRIAFATAREGRFVHGEPRAEVSF